MLTPGDGYTGFRPPRELLDRVAQERGLPVGIIYSPEEVMEDRHFVARGFPVEVEHENLGRSFTYPGAPYVFHGSPWRIQRRAPLLGEHNEQVFASLEASLHDKTSRF